MSTYTTYYDLEKYESSDRPNLRDQYNSSMDKIDAELHTQAGNIASASATVGLLQTTVAEHTTQIATAQSTATSAASVASSAASNASAALGALAGCSLAFISDSDKGTKWNSVTTSEINGESTHFQAVIVQPEGASAAIMIAHVKVVWNSASTFNPSTRPVLTLTDWSFAQLGGEEIFPANGYLDAVYNGHLYFQAVDVNAPYQLNLSNAKAVTLAPAHLNALIVATVTPRS